MAPAPPLSDLIAAVEADAGSPDPLDQLAAAVDVAGELAQRTDDLLGHFVEACRGAGRSWTEISSSLGVTRQAAHKRFAVTSADLERLTPRASASIEAAAEVAKGLGHTFVGTEHLLLGLFELPGTVAERVLTGSGLTRDGVEAEVLARMPRGRGASTDPPYTPRAAEALAGAVSEAVALGHNYVGTEHILLSLFRDRDSLAAEILMAAGATQDAFRVKVVELLIGFTRRS